VLPHAHQNDPPNNNIPAEVANDEVEIAGVQDDEAEIAGVQFKNENDKIEHLNQNNYGAEDNNDSDSDEDDSVGTVEEMNAKYGKRSHNYNLRERKCRDYSHLFANAEQKPDEITKPDEIAGSFGECSDPDAMETPQMNMQQGIRVFGKKGIEAVKKEMLQLYEWKVMLVKDPWELTYEQKKEALAYLMFLKRKCCCKIKG